jgi:hypothetical protein
VLAVSRWFRDARVSVSRSGERSTWLVARRLQAVPDNGARITCFGKHFRTLPLGARCAGTPIRTSFRGCRLKFLTSRIRNMLRSQEFVSKNLLMAGSVSSRRYFVADLRAAPPACEYPPSSPAANFRRRWRSFLDVCFWAA